MAISVTWPQVLAWRLKRQFVDPVAGPDAVSVVRRLTAVLGAFRNWDKGSWQRGHGVTAAEVAAILDAVPKALDGRTLTREELVEGVIEVTGEAHLMEALTSGWGALLKPLSFLGELCYGPPRDGRVTFVSPRDWVPGWPAEARRVAALLP
ncbi:hypothetical protein ABZV14_28140 [Streptosporangium canum]|uniref:hypothetical protein n=1 Tax=Streptosporangium canum TaxID=324952 RepID=UPI0033BC6FBC